MFQTEENLEDSVEHVTDEDLIVDILCNIVSAVEITESCITEVSEASNKQDGKLYNLDKDCSAKEGFSDAQKADDVEIATLDNLPVGGLHDNQNVQQVCVDCFENLLVILIKYQS